MTSFTSWRTRRDGGIIWPMAKGLRTRTDGVMPVQGQKSQIRSSRAPRLKNQELLSPRAEDGCLTREETERMDWMMPNHVGEGGSFYSVY